MTSSNPFSHIDLRVDDLATCVAFYSEWLPALGFSRWRSGPDWVTFTTEGTFPNAAFFGINESPSHRPNETRIAFGVPSREDVDWIAALLRKIDANVSSGPRDCPEYSPDYYAVFFEDPAGNLLEILHRAD